MKLREDIIAGNPILDFCARRGIALKQSGREWKGLCPLHKEKSGSFTVDPQKNVFHCFGCNQGGSVIDLKMKLDGLTIQEAMRELGGEDVQKPAIRRPMNGNGHSGKSHGSEEEQPLPVIDTIYSYRDGLGQELYQVVRMKPKNFRQRHLVDGKWVWNMQGVERVLYNLPAILKSNSQFVWVVEGEKDADNLKKLGFVATCNVGGAGKWLDGYSESLKGKEVILCGDNDPPGEAHTALVLDALAKKAKTCRVVKIPAAHKDVSDFIETFGGDKEAAAKALFEMFESATVLTGGIAVPVQTMAELESEYAAFTAKVHEHALDLGGWIPSLRFHIRPLTPGELVTILAATGVGKTAALQNIATSTTLPALLFEFELPGTLTFERFAALATNRSAVEVFNTYRSNSSVEWKATGKLNHISVCSKSHLAPDEMERIIIQTELKTGIRPRLVMVDYHQLVGGQGKTRYERASFVAEQLKIVAKNTKTIVIVSSQVGRKPDDAGPEIYLNDGKDSGSVENSSGLVLGMWRDEQDARLMHLKILKNTKGNAGPRVKCNFDGPTLRITERAEISPIDEADIPPND